MKLEPNKNLTILNNVSCASITCSGDISCNSISSSYLNDVTISGNLNVTKTTLNYITLPNLSSNQNEYKIPNLFYSVNTQYIAGWHSQSFTLPIGYWLICINLYMDVSVVTTWIFGIGTALQTTLDGYCMVDSTTSSQSVCQSLTNYYACSTQATLYMCFYKSGTNSVYLRTGTFNIVRIA